MVTNYELNISFCWLSDCLTSNLMPLKPFPIPPVNDCTREVCEMEDTGPERDVNPYTSFIHHLYVYPQSLNFDNQKTFARARNIACFIELRDSDVEDAKPLCVSFKVLSTLITEFDSQGDHYQMIN